jgi:hypothetical protein
MIKRKEQKLFSIGYYLLDGGGGVLGFLGTGGGAYP